MEDKHTGTRTQSGETFIAMIFSSRSLISFGIIVCTVFACLGRSTIDSDSPAKQAPAGQDAKSEGKTAELEKLIRDQAGILNDINNEKSSLQDRSLILDQKIKVLNEQLTSDKTLTVLEKNELQKQISDLSEQKAGLDKLILELNTKNAEIQKQIEAIKATNEQAQKEIASANQKPAAPKASPVSEMICKTSPDVNQSIPYVVDELCKTQGGAGCIGNLPCRYVM